MIKTIDYQHRWFQNPLLLPIIAVTVGLYWLGITVLGMNWLFCLVVMVQVVLFFLLFQRPVWAIASLIVGQLSISSFQFSLFGLPMSLRLFWTILALVFLLPFLMNRGKINLGSRARNIIIPAFIFFILATISNLINTDLYTSLRYLREPATALVILFLLPAAVENEKDLKILGVVALMTCAVSALVALIQTFTTSASVPLVPGMSSNIRVSGLALSPWFLGYMFPVVLLPIISVYFLKGVNSATRVLLIFLFILIALGLYYSYTRSGVYSAILGVLVIIFFMRGKPKRQLMLFSIIIFAIFFGIVFALGNRYVQGFTSEQSAAGRLVLWQAGLNIALNNPVLGIGVGQFMKVSPEYASTISVKAMQTLGSGGVLGVYSVHDDYLTVWSSFGTMALLVYLWLLVSIIINFIIAYRHSQTRFFKGFTLGCIGVMAALILFAAVNNLLESSELMWVLGGLSIATTKMALSKEFSSEKKYLEIPPKKRSFLD